MLMGSLKAKVLVTFPLFGRKIKIKLAYSTIHFQKIVARSILYINNDTTKFTCH